MVAQAGVNAILNEVFASPFDAARNNSAPDDNVLVGNLFGVDVHEYLPTNRGEQRAKRFNDAVPVTTCNVSVVSVIGCMKRFSGHYIATS